MLLMNFATIGNNLASSIPLMNESPLSYLTPQKPNSFYLFPTTADQIENVISSLNSNKASGPYSIPTKLLKILKNLISKPLELLFNCSFATGIVPDNFKVARVIPVFKKGSLLVLATIVLSHYFLFLIYY